MNKFHLHRQIELDKAMYPLRGKVTFTITDPDKNIDPNAAETISADRIQIATTSDPVGIADISATETGTDTGEFTGFFILTTDIDAGVGDGLTVRYTDEATAEGRVDVSMLVTASVTQTSGSVEFDQATYLATETAIITVEDPDINSRPSVTESTSVKVYSSSDPAGVSVTLIETGPNTGTFTGTVLFTAAASVGSTLKVLDGDTVTAKYVDEDPDPLDVPGYQLGWAKLALTTARIGVAIAETPITSTAPVLQDQSGNVITTASRGTMVLLTSEIANTGATDQAMLYIVQVKDSAGSVVSLSFMSGTVPAGTTSTLGISWTPTDAGSFTVEVFAWKSWTDPTPLSAEVSTSIVSVT